MTMPFFSSSKSWKWWPYCGEKEREKYDASTSEGAGPLVQDTTSEVTMK